MEEELEPFADEDYKPKEIEGRTTLQLHGEPEKRKRVEAEKVRKILEAIKNGWDIDVQYVDIQGAVNIEDIGLEKNQVGKLVIKGRMIFIGTKFTQDAFFRGATFTQNANFNGAKFTQDAFFSEAKFTQNAYFNGARFDYPGGFSGVIIQENGVKEGFYNEVLLPIVKFLTRGKKTPGPKPVTDVSTINTENVIDGSSNPYLKRYIDDEQWIKSWRDRGGWGKKIAFFVWELTSHCGRSICLWSAWSFFIALVFAFIFTPAPDWWPHWWWGFWRIHGPEFEQTAPSLRGQPVGLLSCFYFSIVNFTTLGFGDIVAINSIARVLVTVEVVLGYVMLGGLISIFANKFARRS